jgi:hypothetical protein
MLELAEFLAEVFINCTRWLLTSLSTEYPWLSLNWSNLLTRVEIKLNGKGKQNDLKSDSYNHICKNNFGNNAIRWVVIQIWIIPNNFHFSNRLQLRPKKKLVGQLRLFCKSQFGLLNKTTVFVKVFFLIEEYQTVKIEILKAQLPQ